MQRLSTKIDWGASEQEPKWPAVWKPFIRKRPRPRWWSRKTEFRIQYRRATLERESRATAYKINGRVLQLLMNPQARQSHEALKVMKTHSYLGTRLRLSACVFMNDVCQEWHAGPQCAAWQWRRRHTMAGRMCHRESGGDGGARCPPAHNLPPLRTKATIFECTNNCKIAAAAAQKYNQQFVIKVCVCVCAVAERLGAVFTALEWPLHLIMCREHTCQRRATLLLLVQLEINLGARFCALTGRTHSRTHSLPDFGQSCVLIKEQIFSSHFEDCQLYGSSKARAGGWMFDICNIRALKLPCHLLASFKRLSLFQILQGSLQHYFWEKNFSNHYI